MGNDELKYWLGFSRFNKFGSKRLQQLISAFPSIQLAWEASSLALSHAGLDTKTIESFIIKRAQINLEEELEKIYKENIKVITLNNANYPELLKETHTPPLLLFYKGNLDNLNKQTIAVVGTRKFSFYGKQVVINLTNQLLDQNIRIVSGLALGIDTLAHSTSVKKKIPTFAVLGTGLDSKSIYPRSNFRLAEEIIAQDGIIFSEYPTGTMPLRHHFPARNRIISGLSRGTLVIEAGERSGALITAKFALDQNREVFAVPGPINHPNSAGTNALIKRGAKTVTCIEDILEELNIKKNDQPIAEEKQGPPLTTTEENVIKHISQEPIHINNLAQLTGINISELNSTLMTLEIKNKVKNIGNMNYSLNI